MLNIELQMPVAPSTILVAIIFTQLPHFILFIGPLRAVSNRDSDQFPSELPGFGGRAKRTVRN